MVPLPQARLEVALDAAERAGRKIPAGVSGNRLVEPTATTRLPHMGSSLPDQSVGQVQPSVRGGQFVRWPPVQRGAPSRRWALRTPDP